MSKEFDKVLFEEMQKEDEFNQIVDIETEDVDMLIGEDDDPQSDILFSREIPDDDEDLFDEDDL